MSRIVFKIPEAVNEDGVTFYSLCMETKEAKWTFRRRYKDFFELHENLVALGFVEKEALPPKKLFGSKDPSFILKRRRDLEYYIRYLLEKEESRAPVLPQSLVDFLELSLYDLDYILGGLSSSKDSSTTSPETKELWNPLTLHAITRRLSTHDIENEHYPSLYKYCADLPNLGVKGSEDPFGSSDILPNTLQFNFKAFQSLKCLRLERIRFEAIESLESLKDSLEELSLNHCPSLTSIQSLMRSTDEGGGSCWRELKKLDLRHNAIEDIDPSCLSAAPVLSSLSLGHNNLSTLENLSSLPHLDSLDLSFNHIKSLSDLHAKLGQIRRINLSGNALTSLEGFYRLFSLTHLSVSGNKIRDLDAVTCIATLPVLESLNLSGNPVATTLVDYRLKILESFGKRCPEIKLDNELASQQEIDKVSVLMALRVAREGKSPTSLFGNLPRKV